MYCDLPEFARCCFCMPLRRGVLTFGYINIVFSLVMVGLYSICIHHDSGAFLLYHGMTADLEESICLAIYCVDIIFYVLLVYGAHKRHVLYLRIFYYYMIATTGALVIMELVSVFSSSYMHLEMLGMFFVGFCVNLYLLFLVRSLIKKMEHSGGAFGNPLQQFVNGEVKVESNGIYPSIVVPIEDV